MRSTATARMVMAALFAAVTAVATAYLKMPGLTGYYHLGDGFYYTAALLLGPWAGAVAGGLGGALADVLAGYPSWAPLTLAIKGLGGWLAGSIAWGAPSAGRRFAGLVVAALLTIVGYPLATAVAAGWPAALTEFYLDLGQTGVGIVIAFILYPPLRGALPHLVASREAPRAGA